MESRGSYSGQEVATCCPIPLSFALIFVETYIMRTVSNCAKSIIKMNLQLSVIVVISYQFFHQKVVIKIRGEHHLVSTTVLFVIMVVFVMMY